MLTTTLTNPTCISYDNKKGENAIFRVNFDLTLDIDEFENLNEKGRENIPLFCFMVAFLG